MLLSIEVADLQLDCMQRLVSGLCTAPGGLELLCRLPFAHNLAVSVDNPAGVRATRCCVLRETRLLAMPVVLSPRVSLRTSSAAS